MLLMQVGFGRAGDAFWSFDAQGATPDIGESHILLNCLLCMTLTRLHCSVQHGCLQVFTLRLHCSNSIRVTLLSSPLQSNVVAATHCHCGALSLLHVVLLVLVFTIAVRSYTR
jgi:hypothetical protein